MALKTCAAAIAACFVLAGTAQAQGVDLDELSRLARYHVRGETCQWYDALQAQTMEGWYKEHRILASVKNPGDYKAVSAALDAVEAEARTAPCPQTKSDDADYAPAIHLSGQVEHLLMVRAQVLLDIDRLSEDDPKYRWTEGLFWIKDDLSPFRTAQYRYEHDDATMNEYFTLYDQMKPQMDELAPVVCWARKHLVPEGWKNLRVCPAITKAQKAMTDYDVAVIENAEDFYMTFNALKASF